MQAENLPADTPPQTTRTASSTCQEIRLCRMAPCQWPPRSRRAGGISQKARRQNRSWSANAAPSQRAESEIDH